MPLRDILRGIGTFAEITEEALKPAGRFLPAPLRAPFGAVLRSLHDAGGSLAGSDIGKADIDRAAAFVTGAATGPEARAALVAVLAHAWALLSRDEAPPDRLFSETVTAACLALAPAGPAAPAARAAELFARLRRAHAAAQLPGLAADATGRADERLFAAFLWLLAERAEDLPGEDRLLKMAYAMARTIPGDAPARDWSEPATAAALDRLRRHL
jgi:hypothetical protein